MDIFPNPLNSYFQSKFMGVILLEMFFYKITNFLTSPPPPSQTQVTTVPMFGLFSNGLSHFPTVLVIFPHV